ncbi:MAG: hypothetical protein DLM70_00100 [Chloroflexi bacterium]|nr:MAG: hypothetical protein DLM70_00100 [Chloroflexota bacterium]
MTSTRRRSGSSIAGSSAWRTGREDVATAILAGLTFRKQSQEVTAIEQQVKDQEEVTRHQAKLLEIQSRQLELQQKHSTDRLRNDAASSGWPGGRLTTRRAARAGEHMEAPRRPPGDHR